MPRNPSSKLMIDLASGEPRDAAEDQAGSCANAKGKHRVRIYWRATDLMRLLGYADFQSIRDKAQPRANPVTRPAPARFRDLNEKTRK